MTGNLLAQKAVLASLNISKWGARKRDEKVTAEVHRAHGASRDSGAYSKRLIDLANMKEIGSVYTEARNYHYRMTQPWMDDGQRLLPTALYLEYTAEQQRLRREYEAAVAKFVEEYPSFIQKAQKSLNGLFNAHDYPRASQIASHFSFDLRILPCPDTDKDDFRIAVASEHVEDIRRDIEKRMNAVMDGTLQDSAERIQDVVGHMAERLKAYKPAEKATKGAKKKKGVEKAEHTFRDSLVENVRELAALLPAFNLKNDPTMIAITERIAQCLCANDADDLRENDKLRRAVAKDADAILRDVSQFIA